MGQPTPPCNTDDLRRLLEGGVPEVGSERLIEHLDSCEACRHALEGMAAREAWWEEARRLVRPDAAGGTAPVDRGRDAAIAGGAVPDAPGRDEEELDFLTPSAAPGSLGRLGPYEILGVLGHGGMGLVLRGHDPALNRPVAIKVLAAGSATGALARRRFAREARAAAAVVHEHVVAIHAVDEADGRPYLVMQYIAGRSLQERIGRDGPLRVEEVLRIGMQAAAGLAAAHAQGLVHRDVKPANILLENGVERVKLTDFGLARSVDDSSLTQAGVVAGTPQYMAPEQARGEPVDHRADLFGLGSVMYAMCTGRSPFRAESTPAVLRRICDDRPRPVRELNPEVPEWLDAIIARLHAKDPAGRYQSASEVAGELAEHLARLQAPAGGTPRAEAEGLKTESGGRARARPRSAMPLLVAAAAVAAVAWLARAPTAPARFEHADRPSTRAARPAPEAVPPSPAAVVEALPPGPPGTVVGVVRDRETKAPVAGVRLSLTGRPGGTMSGPDGRFELRGRADAPPSVEGGMVLFRVAADPGSTPHLGMNIAVKGGAGAAPDRVEIGLARGIPFRLRLTDGATGGPVRGARVVYRPLHPNPFVAEALPPDASAPRSQATEGPDGVYRGVALPGPGAIGVENYVDHYGPTSVDPVAHFLPGESAGKAASAETAYGTRQLLAVEVGGGHGIHLLPQDAMSGVLLVNPRPGPGPLEFALTLRDNRVGEDAR